MTSLDEVLAFRHELFDESLALVKTKGADYSGASKDTLANIRMAETMGIVPTAELGVLVRLSDKFARLAALMQPGVRPEHESLRDTVRDIHNYVDYALLLHEDRHNNNG